ncbi:MAG TPA: ABC transporter permease [Terracidiphilus sp.]|nr:ABC transporter permease [Terracidiphilus sp.]
MELIRILFSRCTALFRRQTLDEELDEELRSHIDFAVEEKMKRGMSAQAARTEAMRAFGGVTQTTEAYREQRGFPIFEAMANDLRFGLRQLVKSPAFALTAILTLALGIGASTAIFSVVKAVLLAPLPYKDPGRIMTVWTANPVRGGHPLSSSAGDFAIWKQRSAVFEDLAPSFDDEKTLTGQGAPLFLISYAVSANYLRILGVEPQLGRLYTDQEDSPQGPKVALLSDHIWRTTFHSDPGIVTRTIRLDGIAYTVLGVMPRGFDYPTSVEIWTPSAMTASAYDDFNHPYVRILGRLRSGVTLAQAQKTLNDVEAQVAAAHPQTDSGNRVVVVPLREQLDGDIRKPLLILMGAVGLMLLIACANTAGLSLARNAERQKEIAVRFALGATRLRVLRQFVTESLLLAMIGGAGGILLALAGNRFLLKLFPNEVANLNIPKVTQIPMDFGVLMFAFTITLLTALLFGIVPVLKGLRTEASAAMKETSRGSTTTRRTNRSRSAVVVTEVALSLILMTGAGLVVASFQKVINADLGFQPDHVLSLQLFLPPDHYPDTDPTKRRRFVQEVENRLNELPGVESAGTINFLPLSGFWGTSGFLLRGQAPPKEGQAPEADNRIITPGYLRTMGIKLLRGRNFTDADRAGSAHVAMINQTMAKQFFKGKDPIGEELNLGSLDKPDWWEIVGVTGDVKAFGQDQPTHLDMYRPFDQVPFPLVAFTLRTKTDPASMVKSAEEAVWYVDPNLPVLKAIPMNLLASQTLAVRRASSALISAFAMLALVLTCIGIYGVMAYAVAHRRQEIGVRMALGAPRGDVLRMMMGLGVRLTLLGVVIGLVGAFVLTRLMTSLLFEVNTMNPLIFSIAVIVLIAVAMAASYLPSRRAASIDPMQALRTE